MAKTLNMFSLILAMSLAITATRTAQAQVPGMAPSPFSDMPMTPGSAGAPVPGMDCTNSLLNMSSCLTYVEAGSNMTVPEKGCCPSLASLVDNQPVCLCQLLASGESFGIKIDTTKALMLPTACKVQTPPVSLCSVLGIPVASPTGPSASPSPASGGPEEPGSGPLSGSPTAAPPSTTSGSTATRATSLAAFITLLTIALFCELHKHFHSHLHSFNMYVTSRHTEEHLMI